MEHHKTICLLEQIILVECEKHYTDLDADLVSECVEFLLELEGVVVNRERIDNKKKELIELMKQRGSKF